MGEKKSKKEGEKKTCKSRRMLEDFKLNGLRLLRVMRRFNVDTEQTQNNTPPNQRSTEYIVYT